MTASFERNRHLNSLMEARKQNAQIPPPTPLTIRSKRVNDSPNNRDHEGTPSKRREIIPNEMNPLFGEPEVLEAMLSRNDKAQGLDPRLIIHGKRKRGQK